jgi:hypothetical protein
LPDPKEKIDRLEKAQRKDQIGSRRLDLKFVSFEFGRKLQLLTWEYPPAPFTSDEDLDNGRML